jgi:hypothetical protein
MKEIHLCMLSKCSRFGAAMIAICYMGCATELEHKGKLQMLGSFDSYDTLVTAFEKYRVPIVIVANKLYVPDSFCAKRRQHEIAADSLDRTIGGNSAGRNIAGDSAGRALGGDSVARRPALDSVGRTIGGESLHRTTGSDSAERSIGGDSVARSIGGDSGGRTLAGDSTTRSLGGESLSTNPTSNSTSCGCAPSADGRGFFVEVPNATTVSYFDGTNMHSAVNSFVPIAN